MADGAPRREPASVNQRVLHLMEHYRGRRGGLNNPVLYRMPGRCDLLAFGEAVGQLSSRHEALRTTFTGRGQRLTQLIHDQLPAEITTLDLSEADDPVALAQQALGSALSTPIDVANAPVNWLVLQRADDHLICATVHHLATDGWSNELIARDAQVLYLSALGDRDQQLPPVQWQYPDFARWQRDQLEGTAGNRHRDYWQRQLDGAHSPFIARQEGQPDQVGVGLADAVRFTVDAGLTERLKELAAAERTTLFTVLLAVFEGRLYAETGDTDISVATLFANRTRPELASTVGCVSTMGVLRTRLGPEPTMREAIRGARATVLSALGHQGYPLQLLPSNTISTVSGRADDVVFQMLPSVAKADLMDVEIEALLTQDRRGARFKLEVILAEESGRLAGTVRYALGSFERDWASAFATAYLRQAASAVTSPDEVISREG